MKKTVFTVLVLAASALSAQAASVSNDDIYANLGNIISGTKWSCSGPKSGIFLPSDSNSNRWVNVSGIDNYLVQTGHDLADSSIPSIVVYGVTIIPGIPGYLPDCHNSPLSPQRDSAVCPNYVPGTPDTHKYFFATMLIGFSDEYGNNDVRVSDGGNTVTVDAYVRDGATSAESKTNPKFGDSYFEMQATGVSLDGITGISVLTFQSFQALSSGTLDDPTIVWSPMLPNKVVCQSAQ